jgi:hypothetical protein
VNERIRQLREQAEEWVCKNYPDAMDDNDEFHAQTMEKFAELIVKECAVIGNKAYSDIGNYTYIGDKIKQHFGVEE